jgi:RNA polymerase subunit RPABC4/transcription elongation factor Spt4
MIDLQPLFDSIGDVLASPVVQLAFQATALYVVVVWLAAAYWAFRDMQLRTENPILPYLAASFIVLFTPIFFPLAVFVYRVVRPQEKIDEVYERNLAEEALLNEVEAVPHCPTCQRRVHPEWIICPTCRTRLNRVCPNCSRLVGLDWSLCAWCGKDFERRDVVAATLEPLPGGRETLPAGRSAPLPRLAADAPAALASGNGPVEVEARTGIRAGVRRSARSAGSPDPLPER